MNEERPVLSGPD